MLSANYRQLSAYILLPFLEQQALYNSINQNLTVLGIENQTIHHVSVTAFACPSDPDSGHPRNLPSGALAPYGVTDPPGARSQMVFASYGGCVGSTLTTALPLPGACQVDPMSIAQNNGVFNDVGPITIASVTDGLNSTIFVVEKSTTALRNLDALGPEQSSERGWYITGNWGDTLASSFYPPNAYKTVGLTAAEAQYASASSLHPSGFHALMGDGSVHFLKETLESWSFDPSTGYPVGASRTPVGWWANLPRPGVWQNMSTRSGAEVVGAELY